MKTLLKRYFITVPALTLILSSCDYVDKPLQNLGLADVDSLPDFPANPNTQRNVLLEEFTGHTCNPCPGAAATARQLHDYYAGMGKQFIMMGIHTLSLATPYPVGSPKFTTDFRTDQGDSIANNLFDPSIPYTPIGFINRTPYTGDVWIQKGDWQDAADLAFAKPLVANMQMIIDYDSITKKGVVFAQTEFTTSTSGDFFLVIALTQDSIIDWQTNGISVPSDPSYPAGEISNYVHRHVFRGCVTPLLGIQVASGTVAVGQEVILPVSINLNGFPVRAQGPAIKQKDLALVAYVYDASNNFEIVQVIEKHLLEH